MPLGERHVVLTDHVFNERGESEKPDSTHLSSLRPRSGSTSFTSQPSGIDHLMILKYSQHSHNNEKYIGELFAIYLYCCKDFMESSGLSKCPEAETESDSHSSDSLVVWILAQCCLGLIYCIVVVLTLC